MKIDLQRICKIAKGVGGGSGNSGGNQQSGGGVAPHTPKSKIPGHEQQDRDDLDVGIGPTELDEGWEMFTENLGHFEPSPKQKDS